VCQLLFVDFKKHKQDRKICTIYIYYGFLNFMLQFLFETFYVLINLLSVMTKMHVETHVDLHVKCPVFRCSFNQNLNVSADFSKTTQYQIS
jgi:hypothetical protein